MNLDLGEISSQNILNTLSRNIPQKLISSNLSTTTATCLSSQLRHIIRPRSRLTERRLQNVPCRVCRDGRKMGFDRIRSDCEGGKSDSYSCSVIREKFTLAGVGFSRLI